MLLPDGAVAEILSFLTLDHVFSLGAVSKTHVDLLSYGYWILFFSSYEATWLSGRRSVAHDKLVSKHRQWLPEHHLRSDPMHSIFTDLTQFLLHGMGAAFLQQLKEKKWKSIGHGKVSRICAMVESVLSFNVYVHEMGLDSNPYIKCLRGGNEGMGPTGECRITIRTKNGWQLTFNLRSKQSMYYGTNDGCLFFYKIREEDVPRCPFPDRVQSILVYIDLERRNIKMVVVYETELQSQHLKVKEVTGLCKPCPIGLAKISVDVYNGKASMKPLLLLARQFLNDDRLELE